MTHFPMIVDAHLDLAYNVDRGRDVTRPACEQPVADKEVATVGLPDLRAGGVGLICATIFCSPRKYVTAEQARAIALNQLDWYRRQVKQGRLRMVSRSMGVPPMSSMHARDAHATNGLAAILLMEGADA